MAVEELKECNLKSQDYGKMITILQEQMGHTMNSSSQKKVGLMLGLEGGYLGGVLAWATKLAGTSTAISRSPLAYSTMMVL